MIFPIYLDKNRTSGEGRRVPKYLAVESPHIAVIAQCARNAGYSVEVEAAKRHPKDPSTLGCIFVERRNASCASFKREILQKICDSYSKTKETLIKATEQSQVEPQKAATPAQESSSQKERTTVVGPGGILLQARPKKGKKK